MPVTPTPKFLNDTARSRALDARAARPVQRLAFYSLGIELLLAHAPGQVRPDTAPVRRAFHAWRSGRRRTMDTGVSQMTFAEVTRYRAGMAALLTYSVTMTIKIERVIVGGWEEARAQIDLDAYPIDGLRIDCGLLLRKARIHVVAAQHANDANNLHSLAVQMRPALECAGQIVLTMHNLVMDGSDRGVKKSLGHMEASAFRHFIRATKGEFGRKEFEKMLSAVDTQIAAHLGIPSIGTATSSKGSSRQADKVAMLAGGNGWYDYLSERFCHGRADWKGPSCEGGVVSMDTVPDEITFAYLMDYLVNQVAVMNAYAVLCPVAGDFQQAWANGWVDATLAHRRKVWNDSNALRKAALAALSGNPAQGTPDKVVS